MYTFGTRFYSVRVASAEARDQVDRSQLEVMLGHVRS